MGFFSKKPKKTAKKTAKKNNENSSDNNTENNITTTTTTVPQQCEKVKGRSSIKRCLSSNSMRKILEVAQCLTIIGDDLEEKRLSGKYE